MGEVSSLFSLCVKAIVDIILQGCCQLEDLFELPADLFDSLLTNLPPVALQDLHEISQNICLQSALISGRSEGRKRRRCDDFTSAWMELFRKRWPEAFRKQRINQMEDLGAELSNLVKWHDWQQLYWENHLQCCLDEAAERAMLPSFHGNIGASVMSDGIMSSIGNDKASNNDHSKLLYQCNRFGHYVRCLRLQNVLCVPETSELLGASKLQSLVFQSILSKMHVAGVCMLLCRNRGTLVSVEFIHCRFTPSAMNQIFSSLCNSEDQKHEVQQLLFKSSRLFESNQSSVATGLLSFLSSGRSLKELHLRDTGMGSFVANAILDTLLESSNGLLTLEISDNNIAGWLSKFERSPGSSLLGSSVMMKSVQVLNLRGNNLCQTDIEALSKLLVNMPQLRSLDISENPIEDDGLRSLIPFFVKALGKAVPLSEIMIENCSISGTVVSDLLRSLPTLSEPLNRFSVADNNLGSSVAPELAKFLKDIGVKVLNIEDIGFGPVGFQKLEEEAPEKLSLVRINISKNRGGIRAAHFISRVICQSPDLLSVDAGYNFLPPEALELIRHALEQAKGKLHRLDLTGNLRLSESLHTSSLSGVFSHGNPIIIISPESTRSMPYDDDP